MMISTLSVVIIIIISLSSTEAEKIIKSREASGGGRVEAMLVVASPRRA